MLAESPRYADGPHGGRRAPIPTAGSMRRSDGDHVGHARHDRSTSRASPGGDFIARHRSNCKLPAGT